MTEMILRGDSYEKSCWKWYRMPSETIDWVWDITMMVLGVILGVILEVVYVILMMEMVLGGGSYDEIYWKNVTLFVLCLLSSESN